MKIGKRLVDLRYRPQSALKKLPAYYKTYTTGCRGRLTKIKRYIAVILVMGAEVAL